MGDFVRGESYVNVIREPAERDLQAVDSVGLLKLLQEAQIVLIEVTDVLDAMT
jgi:hypothetical protein